MLNEHAGNVEEEDWASGDLLIEIRGERFVYAAMPIGTIEQGILIKTSATLAVGAESSCIHTEVADRFRHALFPRLGSFPILESN